MGLYRLPMTQIHWSINLREDGSTLSIEGNESIYAIHGDGATYILRREFSLSSTSPHLSAVCAGIF